MEALGIFLGIFADDGAVSNISTLVDYGVLNTAVLADGHLGKNDTVLDRGMALDHCGEKNHRAFDSRAGNDAPAGYQGIDSLAAPAFIVEYEFCRWMLGLVGPDRPAPVIQIEFRFHRTEFHVGFPVGIHCAHVAPVGLVAEVVPEGIGDGLGGFYGIGDDVLAEVVLGVFVFGIQHQGVIEEGGGKHVDAHGCQRQVGPARDCFRISRFLGKARDPQVGIDGHDSEFRGLFLGHFEAADSEIGLGADMHHEHLGIVHGVDVVAAQYHDIVGCVTVHDVDVLEQGVCRTQIPVLGHALLGGQYLHEFTDLGPQETPGTLQVTDQRMGLVLGEDVDAPQSGVDAVGQGKIDDAVFPAKRDRRFGAPFGQGLEPGALSSGKNQHQGVACYLGGVLGLCVILIKLGLFPFLFEFSLAHVVTRCAYFLQALLACGKSLFLQIVDQPVG